MSIGKLLDNLQVKHLPIVMLAKSINVEVPCIVTSDHVTHFKLWVKDYQFWKIKLSPMLEVINTKKL